MFGLIKDRRNIFQYIRVTVFKTVITTPITVCKQRRNLGGSLLHLTRVIYPTLTVFTKITLQFFKTKLSLAACCCHTLWEKIRIIQTRSVVILYLLIKMQGFDQRLVKKALTMAGDEPTEASSRFVDNCTISGMNSFLDSFQCSKYCTV